MNKELQKRVVFLIVQYMNNNNFGMDWSRNPDENNEFICWGKGNHIDGIFSFSRMDGNDIYGVIHPGGGDFKIGEVEQQPIYPYKPRYTGKRKLHVKKKR